MYQNRRVKVTAQPADSVIRLTHKNASAKVTCATSTGGCTSADVAGEDVVCGRGQTWRLPYLHNVFLSKTPRAHDRPPDLRVFYVAAVKIARGHHHRLSTIKSRSVPFARIKYYSGTEIFTIWCAINKKKKKRTRCRRRHRCCSFWFLTFWTATSRSPLRLAEFLGVPSKLMNYTLRSLWLFCCQGRPRQVTRRGFPNDSVLGK